MTNAEAVAGAALVNTADTGPVTGTDSIPPVKTSPGSAPGVPAIVSPPATEPEHAGFDEGGKDADSFPSSPQVSSAQMKPAAEARFVLIPTAEASGSGPPLATGPASGNGEPPPTTSLVIVPKPVAVVDAPTDDDISQVQSAPGPDVPVPPDGRSDISGPHRKRKADAAGINGDNSNGSDIVQDATEKRIKTNGDASPTAAQSGKRASKSFREKRKGSAPVRQHTRRKTRSQGL